MRSLNWTTLVLTSAALIGCSTFTQPALSTFKLTSPDVGPGRPYPQANMLNSFGCSGDNKSPRLSWSGAPEGTKSFVLTMYDPDAPTGSGFWHWVVYNLPATSTSLPAAIGQGGALPSGAVHGKNDGGQASYAGPCPPQGAPAHRYVFTLHALKVEKLPVPPDATPALIGLMVSANRIGETGFTVRVER